MEKAILIMDMPESCDICDFYDDDDRYPRCYCEVPGIGRDVTDYIACRPEWCPLRPFPERVSEGDENDCFKYENILATGYNQCLEDIERMFDNE